MSRTFLALSAILVLAAPAVAQDGSESHVKIDLSAPADMTRLFDEKFKQHKGREQIDDLIKKAGAGTGPFGQQLREMLAKNPELLENAKKLIDSDDPKTQQMIRGVIEQALKNNPELRKQLRERGIQSPDDVQRQMQDVLNGRQPNSPLSPPSARTGPPQGGAEPKRPTWARDLAAWAEGMDRSRLAEPLRNSPAVGSLLKDLTKAGADALKNGPQPGGLEGRLGQFQDGLTKLREWLPTELPAPMKESLGKFEMSRPEFALPEMPTLAPPEFGGATATALDGVANLLPVVAFLAVAVAVVIVARRLTAQRVHGDEATRRQLAALALDAAGVASRADLIRAFETLAVLRVGEPARSLHHRAIEERLSAMAGDADAARRLAALYESLRYAPDEAEPPAGAWTAARRDLARLAGAV